MPLSDRFADALVYAECVHRPQTRKGKDIPYVAHLLAVCATVLEWGGDEDTAIAALLHDAAEDQGGAVRLDDIRRRYGGHVADIVLACTDSLSVDPGQKAPWRERKTRHVANLTDDAPAEVALVIAADKLHNLTALIRDLRREGPATLARFNAGVDDLLWYQRSVAAALAPYRDTAPVDDIDRAIAVFATLAKPAS